MILFQGETGLPGFTGVAGIPVSLLHSLSLLLQRLPPLSLLPPCFSLLFLFTLFFPEFFGGCLGVGWGDGMVGGGGGGVVNSHHLLLLFQCSKPSVTVKDISLLKASVPRYLSRTR